MKLLKLVVGVDGTPRGEHALRAAARLAGPGVAITALTVVQGTESAIEPQAITPLVTAVAGARHRVRLGAAAIEIPRFAEQEAADLIVLGRCPNAPAALRRTGTTTEGILRRARVPVLIVPEGQPIAGSLLAAVPAGMECGEILEAAAALAGRLKSQLQVLHVQPEFALAGVPTRSGLTTVRTEIAKHALGSPDLLVRRGDPAREILDVVRAQRTDVLVIGRRHGAAALDREADSVAARVLAQARCAVLVVPLERRVRSALPRPRPR